MTMGLPADPTTDDRIMAMIRQVVRNEVPRLTFLAPWVYRVKVVNGGPPVTIDVQSTAPDTVPDISGVVLRAGPDGGYATPLPGSSVVVRFLNGDPTRPFIDSLDPEANVNTAKIPALTLLELGAVGSRELAHSLEVDAMVQLVITFMTTTNLYLQAVVIAGSFTDPGNIATSGYQTALGALATALGLELPTMPTVIVKAT
jgi:hypothetical protein